MTEKKKGLNKKLSYASFGVAIIAIALLIFYIIYDPVEDIAEEPNNNQIEETIEKENSKLEEKEREIKSVNVPIEKVDREEQQKKIENVKTGNTAPVPVPETKQATDKEGNKITVTKVPEINPNSSPEDVEKPTKKEPAPTEAPKENPNAEITKPPTSARDENKKDNTDNNSQNNNNNNNTYPNTKPSNDNKDNSNSNTEKTGNPFLDFKAEPTTDKEVRSEDIGDPNKKMGEGDKF